MNLMSDLLVLDNKWRGIVFRLADIARANMNEQTAEEDRKFIERLPDYLIEEAQELAQIAIKEDKRIDAFKEQIKAFVDGSE